MIAWFSNPLTTPIKRVMQKPLVEPVSAEYNVVQPVTSNTLIELLNKHAIPSENVKFVHWKDFDRALLYDADLYAKVISLGRRPDQSLKNDLSVGSYIPLFGNDNEAGESEDFMLYNNEDLNRQLSSKYGGDYLHYNRIN